ncbi:MAG: hypothetical protein KDA99_07475 [Planctomycetales bacterium]|nr:hypothetical protein [Planctomycetales bacterium]
MTTWKQDRLFLILAFVFASALLFGRSRPTLACSVPVFRYALERWLPDDYVVTVFFDGEFTESQRRIVNQLNQVADEGIANLSVQFADVSHALPEDLQQLWDTAGTGQALPVTVVQNPIVGSVVMTRPLGGQLLDELLNSPSRNELAERLTSGDSVVWVLLDGTNQDESDAAFELLSTELAGLQGGLQLPEVSAEDIESEKLLVDPNELKLKFSLLRLSRDDPAEQALIAMLLNSEPDLQEDRFAGQPMAFPVFGRGRVLYALVGKGIHRDTVSEACEFLTGSCQCTVKADNPGVDLLLAYAWQAKIETTPLREIAPPELVGLGGFAESSATVLPTDGATQLEAEQNPPLEMPQQRVETSEGSTGVEELSMSVPLAIGGGAIGGEVTDSGTREVGASKELNSETSFSGLAMGVMAVMVLLVIVASVALRQTS